MSEYESPDLLKEVDRPDGRAVTEKLPVERRLHEDAAQSPAIFESRDYYHGTLSGGASSIKTTDLRTSDTSPLFQALALIVCLSNDQRYLHWLLSLQAV